MYRNRTQDKLSLFVKGNEKKSLLDHQAGLLGAAAPNRGVGCPRLPLFPKITRKDGESK